MDHATDTHVDGEVFGGAVDAAGGGEHFGQVLQGYVGDADRVGQGDHKKALLPPETPSTSLGAPAAARQEAKGCSLHHVHKRKHISATVSAVSDCYFLRLL